MANRKSVTLSVPIDMDKFMEEHRFIYREVQGKSYQDPFTKNEMYLLFLRYAWDHAEEIIFSKKEENEQ